MLQLNLQYLWPPDAKSWFIEKDPVAGKDWGQMVKRATEDEMDGIIDSVDMSLSKLREIVKGKEAWHSAVHGVADSLTQLSDWTKTKDVSSIFMFYINTTLFRLLQLCNIVWSLGELYLLLLRPPPRSGLLSQFFIFYSSI